MRTINSSQIEALVRDLFIDANYALPNDVEHLLREASLNETSEVCKNALCGLCDNLELSRKLDVPVCQDTGMAVVFIDLGQDVRIEGMLLDEAVNSGVRKAYEEGYLRKSVVADPLRRVNTNDNTPAIIHLRLVPGENIKITAVPKGFGSENMSRHKKFTPAASEEDILLFIVDTVLKAGSNPCPPVIVGVGIGGNFEYSAYLAKKALIRDVSERHQDVFYARLEEEALKKINMTGIGAQGFGGDITALAVNIETAPTHIAGLPVAVNMGCWVNRHKTGMI